MTHEMVRRGVLRALVATGTAGLGGCNFGSSDGADGGGDGGGNGAGAATREPLTWAQATREVLKGSDLETLRSAGSGPETIDSRSDAERAFTIVGWHRTVTGLDPERLRPVEDLLERGPEIQRTLSDVESTLSRLDAIVAEMKDTDVPLAGRSVWETAVALSPSLRGFDVAVDESLREVRTWLGLLEDVTGSVGRARESIEAVRNGNAERAASLDTEIDRATSAIDDLEARSGSLRRTLAEYAEITGQVAEISGELGPLAGDVGTVFGEASDQLATAATELEQFNGLLRESRAVLSDLRSNARTTASGLLDRAASLVGPGASEEAADRTDPTTPATPTATPTETPIPQDPPSDPEFVEGFEDGPGNWRGDTGALEHTTDAARGSHAVKLGPRHTDIHLDTPETAVGSYSFWWKVASESESVVVTFEDGDGAELFGMGVRVAAGGLELVVNPDSAGEGASDLMYAQVGTDAWYRLAFTGVDFGAGAFDAALYDVGDVELTRMRQSFADDGDAVSQVTVRNSSDGPVALDHVVFG